jgi:hypothetical protein
VSAPTFGEADAADVDGLHHLGDRADRLLEGPVDVDVVGVEPAQRVGEEVLDRGRRSLPTMEPSGPRISPNLTLTTAVRGSGL